MRVDDWSTLFEGLPVGAFRSLPDGRFVRVNTALARLSGFDTPAELIAAVNDLAVDWFVQPGRRAEILAQLDRDGSARGLVSEIYHQKSRRRIWISENAYVVRAPDGRVAYYEGTVEEVSERVHAHQALAQREALLRDVTAGVPGLVYRLRIRPDGHRLYEFVSDGVRALYGVEPEAVLADPGLLGRLRHAQDHARVETTLQEHLRSGQPESVEFRIHAAGQGEKWVRLSSSVRRLRGGASLLHGVVVDITEARRAEEALRASDQRWIAALKQLGDGAWDWDVQRDACVLSGPLQQKLTLCSGGEGATLCSCAARTHPAHEAATRAVRHDSTSESASATMCSCEAIMHPDDVAEMRAVRQACLDGLTPSYTHEHRMKRRGGGWLWVLSRGIVAQRDDQGGPLRMIGTHTDITERRESDALHQQRDLAEAANEAKSALMSRISHELRTPLNAILGFAQLLDSELAHGTAHARWNSQVLASGRLLLGLVDDVLDLTRAQSTQFTLVPTSVPLAGAVNIAWAMQSTLAAERGVVLHPPAIAPALCVMADPKRLQQVLGNLLSNAIKYNRPGGHVAVEARAEGVAVVVDVIDSGAGIEPEYLPRVFQPFDRLGAERSGVPGTGLGLALCKQLVEAMGGSVGVRSEAGVGSCFTVRLPAAPAPGDAPQDPPVTPPDPATEPRPR